ncbi:hypothetical protein GCM10029963_51120 [Micromonospora andamanensis]
MPRSVELFAGGGGMALGMFNAGFEHEQLIEKDPRACKILETNAERSPDLWKKENVRNMDVLSWLKEAPGLGLVDIDLVAGAAVSAFLYQWSTRRRKRRTQYVPRRRGDGSDSPAEVLRF